MIAIPAVPPGGALAAVGTACIPPISEGRVALQGGIVTAKVIPPTVVGAAAVA